MTEDVGRGLRQPALVATLPKPASGLGPPGDDPARVLDGEIMPSRGCDDEVAAIMDRLDKLQSWLVLNATQRRGDRDFMAAATLVQDTRVLLVERCFKGVRR